MTVLENHCAGCDLLGLPCYGTSCSLRRVPVHYCDNHDCIAHTEGCSRLYKVGDSELCFECVCDIADRNGIDPEDLIENEVEV